MLPPMGQSVDTRSCNAANSLAASCSLWHAVGLISPQEPYRLVDVDGKWASPDPLVLWHRLPSRTLRTAGLDESMERRRVLLLSLILDLDDPIMLPSTPY
jgi:hypothetical protein